MNNCAKKRLAFTAAGVALAATVFNFSTSIPPKQSLSSVPARSEAARVQTANEYLRAFPDSFPAARSVNKYETPNARYCLVHMRLPHLDLLEISKEIEQIRKGRPLDRALHDLNTVQLARVNQGQKEAYLIYSQLPSHQAPLPLWEEGMPAGLELDRESVKGGHIRILRMLADTMHIDSASEAVYEQYFLTGKSCDTAQLEVFEGFRYIPGAAVLLAAEGKARLVPSADNKADKAMRHDIGVFEATARTQMERIEDSFLKQAAQQPDTAKVLSFGALHAFGGKQSCGERYSLEGRISTKDNIHEWNSAHPEMKYSLIEVTPLSYEEPYLPSRQDNKRLLPLK